MLFKACNHQCIGLCGENCPDKCRICDAAEVTEIFFGTEDEPDARFVQLQDCAHIFEVSGLDRWMETADVGTDGQTNIQMKKCPKCSTVIRKNLRYGPIINQILSDIEMVKDKVVGLSDAPLKARIAEVRRGLKCLKAKDERTAKMLRKRLDNDGITQREVECIHFACQVLSKVCDVKARLAEAISEESAKNGAALGERLANWLYRDIDWLMTWAGQVRLQFSEQEASDARQEVERMSLLADALRLWEGINKMTSSKRLELLPQIERTLAVFTGCKVTTIRRGSFLLSICSYISQV